jgi:membrane protease YdiL (CAAX protease family)
MHAFDHLFVALLFVAQPVLGALAFRRYLALRRQVDRTRLYTRTLTVQWIMLMALLSWWLLLDRSSSGLGLVAPGGARFQAGVVLVAVLAAVLGYIWRAAIRMNEADRAKQTAALGDLAHLLPRTSRDFRYFVALSVTAGIVEEILYRGFALWYLEAYLPIWAAVLVSSAAFGAGHSYQGIAGVLRTGLAGLAFAVLYVLTGSIWLPIAAHIAVDVLQGAAIFEILRRAEESR